MKEPHSFEHFPPTATCPVCNTNEDARCILVEIDGTAREGIAEAQPVHLACATVERFNKAVGVLYRKTK